MKTTINLTLSKLKIKKHIAPYLLLTLMLAGGYSLTGSAQVISAGGYHSLAICPGAVQSWGWNMNGQLGDGSRTNRTAPVLVSGLQVVAVVAISAHKYHSLFLKSEGTVWASGYNRNGQLGDGSRIQRLTPVQVTGLTGITAIAAGGNHSLFLKNDSTVWGCGRNLHGPLGDSTRYDTLTPMQVCTTGITAIAAGGAHSLFLKSNGTVWVCGYNFYGQLGIGSQNARFTPAQVTGLSGITAIAAGNYHSIFLKSDSTVWTCGENSNGQLGNGTTVFGITTPVQVSGLRGITAIAGGEHHSLFLKNDGTVWACGQNYFGQLGDSSTTDRTTPVQVSGLTGITAIAAGGAHSLFLKNDGTAWACGYNGYGALSDTTTTTRTTPVQVSGFCVEAISEDIPDTTFSTARMSNSVFTTTDGTSEKLSVQVFPNPSSGKFMINNNGIASEGYQLKIYNMFGEEVTHLQLNTGSLPSGGQGWALDISSQPNGVYFMQVSAASVVGTKKESFTQKLIIQK